VASVLNSFPRLFLIPLFLTLLPLPLLPSPIRSLLRRLRHRIQSRQPRPRFGSDAQSQRLSALLFDGLVERDAEMNLHPDLAGSWDTPTPLTYIFHLRKGISFHDGRPVTCMSR